eukprot:scaffold630_cov399-Prasinococcus_capsulatus_cf.AAC.16
MRSELSVERCQVLSKLCLALCLACCTGGRCGGCRLGVQGGRLEAAKGTRARTEDAGAAAKHAAQTDTLERPCASTQVEGSAAAAGRQRPLCTPLARDRDRRRRRIIARRG